MLRVTRRPAASVGRDRGPHRTQRLDDQFCRSRDIDLLSTAVREGNNEGVFDLNGDGAVDDVDRTVWVTHVAGTFSGDADLNQNVEFADFLALSSNFGLDGGWAEGNFDGKGNVEFADFLMLSANFGKSATAVAAVPEPSAALLLVVGVVCMFRLISSFDRPF